VAEVTDGASHPVAADAASTAAAERPQLETPATVTASAHGQPATVTALDPAHAALPVTVATSNAAQPTDTHVVTTTAAHAEDLVQASPAMTAMHPLLAADPVTVDVSHASDHPATATHAVQDLLFA
jgi:small ligand-binding sensory domain FIST